MTHKVLLPWVTTLERTVARVRTRASERLWGLLADRLTPAQRDKLEGLLLIGGDEKEGNPRRQSALDRLRDGPVRQSPAELARAVERLTEVQTLVRGLPSFERLPRSRLLSLARFAGAAKAQAVARMPERRRLATLLAFARTLEATAQDDVLGVVSEIGK